MNVGLILKRARREWRQLGTLLLAICLVTAFFALAPLYVRAMIQSGLVYEVGRLEDRTLTLISPQPYQPEAWDFVSGQLGAVGTGLTRITRTGRAFRGYVYQYGEPTDAFTPRSGFGHYAYAFSNLRDILRLVEGRWPDRLPPPDSPERNASTEEERIAKGLGMYSTGDVEAVITSAVAAKAGYGVGTRFAVGERPEDRVVVHVVGIVEAVNPDDVIWRTNIYALGGEEVRQAGSLETGYNVAFFVTEGAYTDWIAKAARIGDNDNSSYVWIVALDPAAISADNIADTQNRMTFLANKMAADYPGLISLNPLLKLLNNYVGLVGRVEGPVILLSGAVLVLMLYHLVTTVSLVLEQHIGEWASISSRGASTFQLVFLQASTMLLLCVVGFAAGPPLAAVILGALVRGGPLAPATGGVVPIPGIPPHAFALSGIAALAALVMLTLPAIPAARRSLAQFKQMTSRPPARPLWARFALDIVLMLCGIGFIARLLFYVQGDLGETLSLLLTNPRALIQLLLDSANRTGGLADPLNLVGPALLLTGIALLWLRLFPMLMRILGGFFRRNNGLTGPLSIWNVERDPGHYAQLVLLLIGTLALGTAALALGATRDVGAWAGAEAQTGGSARIDLDPATAQPDGTNWLDLPGVSAAAALTRAATEQRAGDLQTFLVGLDPEEMARAFPATADAVLPLVGEGSAKRRIRLPNQRRLAEITVYPVVISVRMAEIQGRGLRSDKQPLRAGDEGQIDLRLSAANTFTLYYRVVGVTRGFPSLAESQQFVIMHSGMLQEAVNANPLTVLTGGRAVPNQIWLSLPERQPSPGLEAALRQTPGVAGVTYAWEVYNILLREPLPAAIAGMLYAGFWVSLLLSLLDFAFYLAVTARRRSLGFAVLRALGWNLNRIWALLVTEQAVLVIPALLVGIALGAALAYVILPFLALFGGAALSLPLRSLGILFLALLVGFGVLAFVAAWWLRRLNINQVLRLGEE